MKGHYHADTYDDGSTYIAGGPCFNPTCQLGSQERVHVFTDAELRARDERIIMAVGAQILERYGQVHVVNIDAIIAAAEARDQ